MFLGREESVSRKQKAANVQRSTSNIQRLIKTNFVASLCVPFGRLNTGRKNSNELFVLNQKRVKAFGGNEFNTRDKSEPSSDLFELFETNAELMNKILARFCGLNFPMICKRRCATPEQLPGYVIRSS